MKNIIVGQSGGPTAVINASLYGVIHEALRRPDVIGHVYGMENGIEGFLKGRYLELSEKLSKEELELLKLTPAAYLGSCRYKLPEDLSDSFYPEIFNRFQELNIGFFFYIGGNDSMDTVSKLSRYAASIGSDIRFIGVPKTIDNDLILTDHTPGYGSAAHYVASTVREIVLDSCVYDHPSVTIIEIMGRHAGWLTAASVLARKYVGDNPLLIYLPESDFDMETFAVDLQQALDKNTNVVVCVSEGISDADGTFICEYGSEQAQLDTFGHKMLAGCGKTLEQFVRSRFGIKVRSVELNVSQRCSGMVASMTDIEEAVLAGESGVRFALGKETGKMIAFVRDNNPYRIICQAVDVNEVCNKEKPVPTEWITGNSNDIGQAFIDYALPLIQGEVKRPLKDGLPVYLYR